MISAGTPPREPLGEPTRQARLARRRRPRDDEQAVARSRSGETLTEPEAELRDGPGGPTGPRCRAARTGRRARSGPRPASRRARRRRPGGPACARGVRPETRGAGGIARGPRPAAPVLVIVRPRRRRRPRRGPRPSRPTQASFRSSPIASWTREQLVQPSPLDVGGHVVGEMRRRRPGPLRVGGREDLVVADASRAGASVARELGVGLAAEPDDHVGRDGDPRDGLADPAPAARGSARSCTGGPSGGGPHRRPTGPAGGGARRPTGSRPSPRSADRTGPTGGTSRSAGAGSPGRRRRSGCASIARMSSARSGRPARSSWRPAQRSVSMCPKRGSAGRSWPYEFTFWPSSVTSR